MVEEAENVKNQLNVFLKSPSEECCVNLTSFKIIFD